MCVVFISHKLREVLSVAQRICVMRRGKKVAEVRPQDTNPEQLAELMVGERRPELGEHAAVQVGPAILDVQGLSARHADGRPLLRDIGLRVCGGEIVGIAGVDGNGQRELAEVLTGLRPPSGGEVRVDGQVVRPLTPAEVRRRGVAHVPEDRLLRAIVGPMTVEENIALGRQGQPPFARGARIDFEGRRERTESLLESFDVRPRAPEAKLGALSGGNQQKVVLARELDCHPRLLVVVQPTRGLDIAAVAQVQRRLREERARGVGVLLFSLDLEEVLALSDRVYVMFAGQLVGELARNEFEERRIGRMMLGGAEPAASESMRQAHG